MPMWGSTPVDVFTTGSLQFGAYPEFISDGQGGGVFSWYETSPLMSRLQWVDGGGAPQWGSSGVAVTNETSMVHVTPTACLDASSGDVTVFWVRQNSTQSTAGVQANRFDASGSSLWGGSGRQIVAASSSASVFDMQAGSLGTLATGLWIHDTQLGGPTVVGAALDAAGDMQWGFGPVDLGSAVGAKQDLSVAGTPTQRIAAWSGDRDGTNRVYAQNVHADGSLGPGVPCEGDVTGDGLVGADDVLAVIGAWGPCGGCPEDLSGDGVVGADDLLEILAGWGPC